MYSPKELNSPLKTPNLQGGSDISETEVLFVSARWGEPLFTAALIHPKLALNRSTSSIGSDRVRRIEGSFTTQLDVLKKNAV
jgi:hypothetical protein